MEKIKYLSLNKYLRDTFGDKVYKIAIDGGFTCPNRDGKIDTRGCIFCSAGGSGDFAGSRKQSVTEQIEEGKALVEKKFQKQEKRLYIAYFQAFTNTYGPVCDLREKFTEAINHPDVVALSIGTRPDCLEEEVVELLSELNKIKPVWVELGLQTIHEKSAAYIRRGYPLPVFEKALSDLKSRNIYTVVHVILGLPGESREDMLSTVKYVADSGTDGIKLQLLHVLKNTDLAKDYEAGKFTCLTEEEYIVLVTECLKLIPTTMAVHRLTGDGDKKILIAPMWSANKRHVLNELNKRIEVID